MANYSAKILNNAVTALSAQQALIATTANNIANVNTPGYSRRTVELETRVSRSGSAGGELGNGVQVGALQRSVDLFVEKLVREASGEKAAAEMEQSFMGRAEEFFDITGARETVGSSLTSFFTALNDLSAQPSSLELRANVLQKGKALTDSIATTYKGIADLQTEADSRIRPEIEAVNSLTGQIAELNGIIRTRQGAGLAAADEKDKRELLLQQLGSKLSYERVDQEDGQVLISLPGGFPLVHSHFSRNLSVTPSPSFASSIPPSLSGQTLSYIVYDYSSSGTSQHIDLTKIIRDGTGSLSGLLAVRGTSGTSDTSAFDADGTLVDLGRRVESVTRQLLTTFNTIYRGPDADGGTAVHDPSAVDLDGNTPGVFGFFTFSGAADTGGLGADGRATLTDLASLSSTLNIDNFSSILSVAITNPRRIAAGRDADTTTPGIQSASGDARNLIGSGGSDTGLAGLQKSTLSFSVNSMSYSSSTLDEAYGQMVTTVGTARAEADTRASVAGANLIAAQQRRDEVSAVSLDEEFTSLIKYQKAFQASARMLKIADELLQQVMDSI